MPLQCGSPVQAGGGVRLGQVQCPNCGGYKTEVTDVRSIGDFEGVLSKKLPQPIGCLAFLVGLGLALGWQWWFF